MTCNLITGHISRVNQNSTHMHSDVPCSTISNNQDMVATYMSINRGIDKEYVIHIYNGMLLSHKKEWNWVICRDMNRPGHCHTEWSKSEGKKPRCLFPQSFPSIFQTPPLVDLDMVHTSLPKLSYSSLLFL